MDIDVINCYCVTCHLTYVQRMRSKSNEDKLVCQVWRVYFTILQFQMNNALKKAVEVTLLSLITKKTIQPLFWTQVWTLAKMAFNCWAADAAAVLPHAGICVSAFGIAVVSVVRSFGTDEAICTAWDVMFAIMAGKLRRLKGFCNAWTSCWSSVARLFMFIKSVNAFDTLVTNGVTQFWMSVAVEMREKLYRVTDMK